MLRQLGRTGLEVSALGVGLAAIGRPGYITIGHGEDLVGRSVEDLRRASLALLDTAFAAGVRYIDVARSYGCAEGFLASWLQHRSIPPDAITIGTKWGYTYTAGWRADAAVHEIKDHSIAMLVRQVAESRALLGAHLDLLQVHSATLDSGVLEATDVLDELVRLRRDGIVPAIGLTLSGARQAETLRVATSLERGGVRVFDAVQATFNVLETSCGPALAAAHDDGMGVLVKETLANGRLVRGAAAGNLQAIAGRLATSVDALALAFVLEQPWADVVLLGPVTVEQLHSNLGVLEVELDAHSRHELAALRETPDQYWRTRSELPWG
jgi:aryl-alcohol dehydrogenase-like predicted oxidoreductase